MSETRKHPTPPYASFSSFMTFINKLKENTVPGRIDPSVFGNASGSLSYSIIAALKSLKMIGADGVPTPDFITFVNADDDSRKITMIDALQEGFPTLWQGFNLDTATAGQFDEHLRDHYDVKGSTVDKVATFFIAAAKFADINLSTHLKARRPTASSSSSRKSSKQRSRPDPESDAVMPAPASSPPAQLHHPFVQGLLDTLPKTDKFEEWTIDQQAEWLEAAAGIFRLLSKQTKGRITVSVKGGTADASGASAA
jgi:hypothetical protein